MRPSRQAALLAFSFGAITAGIESLIILQSTGFSSPLPALEILEVQVRYGIIAILLLPITKVFAKLLRLKKDTPLQLSAWVFIGMSYLIGNWWIHSELLRNISKWDPSSLAWWIGTAMAGIALHRIILYLARTRTIIKILTVSLLLPTIGQLLYKSPTQLKKTISIANKESPDITLIVIDTLRADHLGCYGYQRDDGEKTSPFIDSLALQGAVFEDCWAQAPWTRPSMASMHSGLHCSSHKVNDTYSRLPEDALTIAEMLQNKGYRTGAFSANDNVSPVFGFHQGFEYFWNTSTRKLISFTTWGDWKHKLFNKILRKSIYDGGDWAALVNQKVIEWHNNNPKGPTFTYIQYIDPHTPYNPPEGGYEFAGDRPDISPILEIAKTFRHTRPFPFGKRATIEKDLLERAIKLYDSEIRYVDSQIEELIKYLKNNKRLDKNDWLFIVSDHGEEFQEHQQWGHGQSLFEEQLHVPLIAIGPGIKAGIRIEEPVNLLDMHATIALLVGQAIPENSPSIPLQALWRGISTPNLRTQYAERLQRGQELQAVREGKRKLISLPDFENKNNRFHMTFNLESNPNEKIQVKIPNWRNGELLDRNNNAFKAPKDLIELLISTLKKAVEMALTQESADENQDIRRKLAEMGYIGEDGDLKLGN